MEKVIKRKYNIISCDQAHNLYIKVHEVEYKFWNGLYGQLTDPLAVQAELEDLKIPSPLNIRLILK